MDARLQDEDAVSLRTPHGGARRSTLTRLKVYPRAVRACGAASNGRCSSSCSASTTSCRGCAGIAAPMRPNQAILIDLDGRRGWFFES